MAKKAVGDTKSLIVYHVDPTECPFREFRDHELSNDYWGLGPSALRTAMLTAKSSVKPPADYVWVDEQTQPLPRSVRQYLHGWIRAEELALMRWDAEVVVFEENNGGKMSLIDTQLSHAQVLLRSSFCRHVLSACYMLERLDQFSVEHQWENFICNIAPEGWRARYHIYSPGMKAGGGLQHRPGLSKNGCYLVRLFYLGAWRCVWVSDQVPVDATDAPLLPFSPLLSRAPSTKPTKQAPVMVTAHTVYLWPLLLCKALLKLAAPDMHSDENVNCYEDEDMPEFDVMHCLTGAMNLTYHTKTSEELWNLLISEVPVFTWDEDDDTLTSTVKSRSTKKPTTKEIAVVKRQGTTSLTLVDTKELPSYALPGIAPGLEMNLLVTMARDLPLKKPLPEPDVALWKYYRWVDWARGHGLYEAYDCPRTRFLKVNGLMKLSYAPHLLDVQSTESITFGFREEHGKSNPDTKKGTKDANRSTTAATPASINQMKEELREWIQYKSICHLVKHVNMLYYPSMFQFTSASSSPPMRITKGNPNKAIDIPAPKSAPLYLQIDGPEGNKLRVSLNMLHPRILLNCSVPLADYIEAAYLIIERFEWFEDCDIPIGKGYLQTRGYDSIELEFEPGRHVCRIWVHSRLSWHMMLLSESTLLLGTRDTVQSAAVKECPWASKFLSALGLAFTNWIRLNRSSTNVLGADREFYRSYQPDLTWDPKVVGYDKVHLHWMFRQALQALLHKKLPPAEYSAVCGVLRRYFCDPDFGFPAKPFPQKPLKEIVALDPCDCLVPEVEEMEVEEEQIEELAPEEPVVDQATMAQLLTPPTVPIVSQVCELATDDLPCGLLKEERDKVIKRHESATYLQALWRGTWARKCLTAHLSFTPDVTKIIMESAFGNLEALSALMNQFFLMYPGAKYAYSVASALTGVYGLNQYPGATSVTPKCKWIPYFQGVFYCHGPVKVHFDLQSTLQYCTVAVYDNDTGAQMPQVYNAHVTFDFTPNTHGYTVMGHGTLNQPSGIFYDVHWQLTVLSSISGLFHICDNDPDCCKEFTLHSATKLHIDEMFIPNRRNILGGIQLSVSKHEAISFRAATTSPELEITAILRTKTGNDIEEIARCSGTGELYWPYIWLEPTRLSLSSPSKAKSCSQSDFMVRPTKLKSFKGATLKNKSMTKLRDHKTSTIDKQYSIEVIAPNGWPLTLVQWTKVDEVRNSQEVKIDISSKKPVKEKANSAKDKAPIPVSTHSPLPGDAYVELECSLTFGGGASAKRDDERDLQFAAAIKAWDAKEVGRNLRGAQIRKDFRTEFLEAPPLPPSASVHTIEEVLGEEVEEEHQEAPTNIQQGPTPVTESGLLEMTVESEEEAKYLEMPEQLKDKFIPLYFLPFCTKERNYDETALVSHDMAEAAKKDRLARIDAAIDRLNELQAYNETHVLGRQRLRCQLLEKLFVDSQWSDKLTEVLEERDEAIARETLNRNLSAIKKKLDTKKK